MTPAKLPFSVWGATQWAAAMLGYQNALGPFWFEVSGFSVKLHSSLFS